MHPSTPVRALTPGPTMRYWVIGELLFPLFNCSETSGLANHPSPSASEVFGTTLAWRSGSDVVFLLDTWTTKP